MRLTLMLGCILSLSVGALIYLLTLSHRNQIEDETAVGAARLAETIKRSINQDMLEKCRRLISAALIMDEPGEKETCQEHCPQRREKDESRD